MLRSYQLPKYSNLYWKLWHLEAELDMWASYAISGSLGEIQGHTRKDQRTYQRKFCRTYSKRLKFFEDHMEDFL